jgi:hypothetical protein
MAARHRVDYGYQPELTEFSVQHLEFRVQSSGFRVQRSEFGVQSSAFRIQALSVCIICVICGEALMRFEKCDYPPMTQITLMKVTVSRFLSRNSPVSS